MRNSLCKILLIVLLIENIRCGVSVRRDKRFLSTLFDGSEEVATPQVIRVYKIPEDYVKNLKFDLKNKTFVQVPGTILKSQNVTVKQSNPQVPVFQAAPPSTQEATKNIPVFQAPLNPQENPKNIPVFQTVPSNPQKFFKIVAVPYSHPQRILKTVPAPQTPSNPQEVLQTLPVSQAAASFNQNIDESQLMNNPLYPQYLQVPNRPAQDFQKRPPQARHVIPAMQFGFTPMNFNQEVAQPQLFAPYQSDPQQPTNYFNYESQNEAQEKSWDLGFGAKKEDVKNLYNTQEFKDLLKEFNVTVDVKKLPEVDLIMSVLGTTTIDDTIDTIKEIANTTEGMDLIRQFLDSEDPEHEGEVVLSDTLPDSSQIQEVPHENENFKPITPIFLSQFPRVSVPATFIVPKKKEKSLWNPKTWFSYENNLETTTAAPEIAVAPKEADSFWDSFTLFFRSNENLEVTTNLPTVKKSPEIPPMFPDLKAMFPGEEIRSVSYYIPKEYVNQVFLTKEEPKSSTTEVPSTTSTTAAPEYFDSEKSFFQNPILVYSDDSEFTQPLKTALDNPLRSNIPEEFTRNGLIRRNFNTVSEPQRNSEFDFVAGKVHKANPDAMQALIKTAKTIDVNDKEQKDFVKMVSTLTVHQINEEENFKNQKLQDQTSENEIISAKQEESELKSLDHQERIEDQTESDATTAVP